MTYADFGYYFQDISISGPAEVTARHTSFTHETIEQSEGATS